MGEVSEQQRWTIQNVASAIGVLSVLFGFWYVREQQLWRHGEQIDNLENRGQAAIIRMDTKVSELEKTLYAIKDRVDVLEYKVNNSKHE